MGNFEEVLAGKEYFLICKKCKRPASTEHNNPECHTCEDWNGCGRDCTLSRVFCKKCGTEEKR